jgi:hypothetical protein
MPDQLARQVMFPAAQNKHRRNLAVRGGQGRRGVGTRRVGPLAQSSTLSALPRQKMRAFHDPCRGAVAPPPGRCSHGARPTPAAPGEATAAPRAGRSPKTTSRASEVAQAHRARPPAGGARISFDSLWLFQEGCPPRTNAVPTEEPAIKGGDDVLHVPQHRAGGSLQSGGKQTA